MPSLATLLLLALVEAMPDASGAAAAAPAAAAGAPTATVAASAPAKPKKTRGEVVLEIGLGGGGSDWRGDGLGYGSLKLGFRLFRVVMPFLQGRLGYGGVDQRMLTMLSIGLELSVPIRQVGSLRGYAAWVHQHEESGAAIANEPGGAFFGVGSGIRHRVGVQAGLGFDAIVFRRPAYDFTVGPEAMFAWLTYSSGPTYSGMVGVTAGGHFRVF